MKGQTREKPHLKRLVARSQFEGISQLVVNVNKLADANAKRSKVKERDRELPLEFHKK